MGSMAMLLTTLFLAAGPAHAAKLADVRVLAVHPGKGSVEVKLKRGDAPKGAYFLVDIGKDDPDSFGKLSLLLQKLLAKDRFTLDLEIPGFSASPGGSYYPSRIVRFSGRETGGK